MKQPARTSMLALVAAIALAFPALAQAQGGGIRDALSSFGQKLGIFQAPQEEHPFLEPELAFMLSAEAVDGHRIRVHFRIADGYYLYRNMFEFRLEDGGDVELGEAELPAGRFKEDEFFGRMEVYYDAVEARLPVSRGVSASGRTPVVLEAAFQGCAEAGFCYPPMKRSVEIVLPAVDNGAGELPARDRNAGQQGL
jgi:thioredoxin:protein disulfide reductase